MKKKLLVISALSLLVVSATAILMMPRQKTFEVCAYQRENGLLVSSDITLYEIYTKNPDTGAYDLLESSGFEYDGNGNETVSGMAFEEHDCSKMPYQYDLKKYTNDGCLTEIYHINEFSPEGTLDCLYSDYDDHKNPGKIEYPTYHQSSEIEYIYDDNGNITDKYETQTVHGVTEYLYWHYEYDEKGRKTFDQLDPARFNPNNKSDVTIARYASYEYIEDANGNLIEKSGSQIYPSSYVDKLSTMKYVYDDFGRLIEEQTHGYVPVRGGNLIDEAEGMSQNRKFTYDDNNNIIKITTKNYVFDKVNQEFIVDKENDAFYTYDKYGRCTQYDFYDDWFQQQRREIYRYDDLSHHIDGLVPTILNKELSFNYTKRAGKFAVSDIKLKLGYFDTTEKFESAKKNAKDYGVALISKANLGGSDFFKAYSEKDEFMSVISFFGKEGIVDENKVLDPNGDYVAFDTVINVPEDKMDEEVCAVIYFTYEDKTEFTYLEDVNVKSAAQNYLNMDREYTATEKAVLSYLAK